MMSRLFNMLSRFIIAFLPRSNHLLISWLLSLSAVILEPKTIESIIVSIVSPSICLMALHSDGTGCHVLSFCMLSFMSGFFFPLSSFTFIKRLFSSSLFFVIRVVSSAYLRILIFLLATLNSACASHSPTFCFMYSAYKLNKVDNIQPWCTPFPILSQPVALCLVLTVASWSAY